MTKSDNDGCGLPDSPVYANYVKHLWKACPGRRRGRPLGGQSREMLAEIQLPQDELLVKQSASSLSKGGVK
ncbi:MAG: hypothetical protein M3458_11470 [Acidobacteriota bacterium]|nr:hypothetical protein [Acidobacteriota bacterium]